LKSEKGKETFSINLILGESSNKHSSGEQISNSGRSSYCQKLTGEEPGPKSPSIGNNKNTRDDKGRTGLSPPRGSESQTTNGRCRQKRALLRDMSKRVAPPPSPPEERDAVRILGRCRFFRSERGGAVLKEGEKGGDESPSSYKQGMRGCWGGRTSEKLKTKIVWREGNRSGKRGGGEFSH